MLDVKHCSTDNCISKMHMSFIHVSLTVINNEYSNNEHLFNIYWWFWSELSLMKSIFIWSSTLPLLIEYWTYIGWQDEWICNSNERNLKGNNLFTLFLIIFIYLYHLIYLSFSCSLSLSFSLSLFLSLSLYICVYLCLLPPLSLFLIIIFVSLRAYIYIHN